MYARLKIVPARAAWPEGAQSYPGYSWRLSAPPPLQRGAGVEGGPNSAMFGFRDFFSMAFDVQYCRFRVACPRPRPPKSPPAWRPGGRASALLRIRGRGSGGRFRFRSLVAGRSPDPKLRVGWRRGGGRRGRWCERMRGGRGNPNRPGRGGGGRPSFCGAGARATARARGARGARRAAPVVVVVVVVCACVCVCVVWG